VLVYSFRVLHLPERTDILTTERKTQRTCIFKPVV